MIIQNTFYKLITLFVFTTTLSACNSGSDAPITVTGGASQVVAFEKEGSTVTSVSIYENTSINDVKIVINGNPSEASNFQFEVVSDDQALLPNGNIIFSGEGKFRTLTITPAANQSGETTLTGTITDASTSESVTGTLLFKVLSEVLHDVTAPIVTEVTPTPTPTGTFTPEYTFHTTEAGTVTYGGDCSSDATSAVVGNNTIIFHALLAGNYSNCTIKITDNATNISNELAVNSFEVKVTTGYITTDFSGFDDNGVGVAIQSDHKILVTGSSSDGVDFDFAVARYNSDGSIDTTFGSNGMVTTAIGSTDDYGNRNILQNDGKILLVGYIAVGSSGRQFALVRYNSDGSLDTSFSGDGKWTAPIASYDLASAITLQSDGKILIAGRALISGNGSDYTLVRFNTDGSLDTTFSGDGIATTQVFGSDFANSVQVQADGKIIVAGYVYKSAQEIYDFGLVRYNVDGTLDTTFSDDGMVITDFGLSLRDYVREVAVQDDGKIVVAGITSNGNDTDFALIRYNSDGSIDSSFGVEGKVVTDFGYAVEDSATDMLIQSDGKILVVGSTIVGGFKDIALARYEADGSLDASFGEGGILTTAIGSADDRGAGVRLQTDGKIVVSGTSFNGSDNDFVVVRYNSDGTLDTQSFGPSL